VGLTALSLGVASWTAEAASELAFMPDSHGGVVFIIKTR
jgi:hypothetical protein